MPKNRGRDSIVNICPAGFLANNIRMLAVDTHTEANQRQQQMLEPQRP